MPWQQQQTSERVGSASGLKQPVREVASLPSNLRLRRRVQALRCRIVSLAVRRSQPLLAAASDMMGNVRLFGAYGDAATPLLTMRHSAAVSDAKFFDSSLFTVGHDAVFNRWCLGGGRPQRLLLLDDGDTGLVCFDAVADAADAFLLGATDGRVLLLDARAPPASFSSFLSGQRQVKCIDTNRQAGSGHQFLTANSDGCVRLWDLRNWSKDVLFQQYGMPVESAFWSPAGDRFVTTTLDYKIEVFDSGVSGSALTSIWHANYAAPSVTNLRCVWHPLGLPLLTVGSMRTDPCRIEFFCPDTGRLIGTVSNAMMLSVVSLLQWHQQGDTLWAANSYGEVFIFKRRQADSLPD